jgi:hypothetical protein
MEGVHEMDPFPEIEAKEPSAILTFSLPEIGE